MEIIEKLKLAERRENVLSDMESLNKKLEGRAPTVTEQSLWDSLGNDFDSLTEDIRGIGHLRDADLKSLHAKLSSDGGGDNFIILDRHMSRKGLIEPTRPHFDNDEYEKRSINRSTTNMKNEDKELRNFGTLCKFGPTSEEYRDIRAADGLYKSDDKAGGYTVLPEQIYNDIIHDLDNEVFMRRHAKIFTLDSASRQGVPILETDVSDTEFLGEISEASMDEDMDFNKLSLLPKRLAKGIKISRDLLDLNAVDVGAYVKSRLTYKKSVTEESKFMTGNGTMEPLGIFTVSDGGVSSNRDVSGSNTATALKAPSLIDCMYNLKGQYLRSKDCRWVFHRDAIKKIRKLQDGEGNFLWQPGIGADRPSTILGVEYIVSEYCPNTFEAGLRVGCIADLKFYGIAQYDTMEIQVLLEKYALTNQVAYLLRSHIDGAPMLENAVSMLTMGS